MIVEIEFLLGWLLHFRVIVTIVGLNLYFHNFYSVTLSLSLRDSITSRCLHPHVNLLTNHFFLKKSQDFSSAVERHRKKRVPSITLAQISTRCMTSLCYFSSKRIKWCKIMRIPRNVPGGEFIWPSEKYIVPETESDQTSCCLVRGYLSERWLIQTRVGHHSWQF